jgi:hypothetical protein
MVVIVPSGNRAAKALPRRPLCAETSARRQGSFDAYDTTVIASCRIRWLFPHCNAADFHGWHTVLALELAALARM